MSLILKSKNKLKARGLCIYIKEVEDVCFLMGEQKLLDKRANSIVVSLEDAMDAFDDVASKIVRECDGHILSDSDGYYCVCFYADSMGKAVEILKAKNRPVEIDLF